MAIISYILIFSTYFFSVFLSFFPSMFSYKQFAFGLAVISVLLIIRKLYYNAWTVSKREFTTIVVAIVGVIMYCATPIFFKGENRNNLSVYNSFRLVIIGQILPIVAVACFCRGDIEIKEKMIRFSPIIGAIFTGIALLAAFNPTSMTSGGYALNENGLGYQTISYMAAYASALLEYYVLTREEEVHFNILKSKAAGFIAFFLIFVNALSVLVGGGRGGFVAYILFLCFTVFLLIRRNQLSLNSLVKGIFIFGVIVLAGYWAISIASNSTVSTNGFSRIIDLFSGSGDKGRNTLKENALTLFKLNPVIGNGLGSILLFNGLYSHNFFLDVMAETGLFGLAIIMILLFNTVKKGMQLINESITESLWMYIFLCGFIMSLFSGYYLDQFPVWWVIAFMC